MTEPGQRMFMHDAPASEHVGLERDTKMGRRAKEWHGH
jgi:hypothetical protein